MYNDKMDMVGRAIQVAGLVEYQNGAVVSRTLLDKNIGTITVFAFDNGEGLSEHTTPYDAFVYILDGSAEITIGTKKNIVGQGECIIMPAHHPHALRALTRFKMMLVMIREKVAE